MLERIADVIEAGKPAEIPPTNATAVDTLKADTKPSTKKKFNIKNVKNAGPIRLVKGFRATTWRPKISLDSQKELADNIRNRIFERRNKYEKFVDKVLGKPTPGGAKQPAPGQPLQSDPDGEFDSTKYHLQNIYLHVITFFIHKKRFGIYSGRYFIFHLNLHFFGTICTIYDILSLVH